MKNNHLFLLELKLYDVTILLSFTIVIVCGLFEWKPIYTGFLLCISVLP